MALMPLMVSIIRHKYELHGSLRVFPLAFGLFQFIFSSHGDKNRVLALSPCSTGKFVASFLTWCPPSPDLIPTLL
ncbi:hypothetical protein LINGRAHAP2_LOCUS15146, partial [Linum grandiflorum]